MAVSAAAHVLDFEEALHLLAGLEVAVPLAVERVGLLESRGRVLGVALAADRDQPPFDRSTRDGFAVRAGEFGTGVLRVAGTVRAGEQWTGPALEQGAAIAIMTGAPLPAGADAVAMVEHVVVDGTGVRAAEGRRLRVGENIVPWGREARAGEVLVAVGTPMDAAAIALAATSGYAQVEVYRRPRVAIAATGDELVELAETPGAQQIRNSNSYALAAMVEAAGGMAVRLPITADRREAVTETLRVARGCDLILLSGGVSMGEYDLVEEGLLAEGAEFLFTGVRMQPGKPVVFGRLPAGADQPEVRFFGLPGNPVSTQVTFHCFAEPLLRRMCGEGEAEPRWAPARLAEDVPGKPELTRLLPARQDGLEVRLVGWQGSGDLAANARANCYLELPAGRAGFAASDPVRVLLR